MFKIWIFRKKKTNFKKFEMYTKHQTELEQRSERKNVRILRKHVTNARWSFTSSYYVHFLNRYG